MPEIRQLAKKLFSPWSLKTKRGQARMPVLLMFYRRHLPHWQRADSALFITWRLFGSLPPKTLERCLRENNAGKKFRLLDRELDKPRYGPTWLKEARFAKIVVNALCHGDEHLRLY